MARAKNYDDPNAFTIRAHEAVLNRELVAEYKALELDLLEATPELGVSVSANAQALSRIAPRSIRYDTEEECQRLVHLYIDWGIAAFSYADEARHADSAGTRILPGLGLQKVREPKHYWALAPRSWLEVFALALARKQHDQVSRLLEIDPLLFKDGRPQHHRHLYRAWVALQQEREDECLAALESAHQAAEKREASENKIGKEIIGMTVRPLIQCTEALVRAEPQEVDTLLVDAFRAHRKFWDRERGLNRGDAPMSQHESGWLALLPIGIMAMARQRGLSLQAESEYAPAWLFS